jgi:hypothetical protein
MTQQPPAPEQPEPTPPLEATATPPHPGWSTEQPPPAPGWTSPTAYPPAGGPPPPPGAPVPGAPVPGGFPMPGGYPSAASAWNRPQAPKPGVIPLRPLGLSEILDGAFSYIRRSPGVVLGISAVIAVLSNIVTGTASGTGAFDPNATTEDLTPFIGQLIGGTLVTTLVTLVFQVIGTGMLTVVITRAVLGQDIGWREAWGRSRGLILALLAVTFLTSLLSFFGLFFLIFPGVFLYVSWAIAVPALMVERCGVIESMRRSWRLVRGSRWRVFGIILLAQIIAGFVGQIIAVPFAFIGVIFDGLGGGLEGGIPIATLISSALAGVIATTITLPFTAGVTALLYVDQRMRREGLDLQLARAAGAAAPTVAAMNAAPGSGSPGASPWTSAP